MNNISKHIIIKTGQDPRHCPEFSAIREEINKINHPSRPEVNWSRIESLALQLFTSNGVDLQTAVYYTLARTQKDGQAGFTEGCELLAGMVVSQWEQLWPQQQAARTEILEWFNNRVSTQLRQHRSERDDLRLVYRAERALQLLCDKLQQVELKRVPRIENLLCLMQSTVKRLEAERTLSPAKTATPLIPSMVYLSTPPPEPDELSCPEAECEEQKQLPPYVQASATASGRFATLWGFGYGVLCSLLIALSIYVFQIRPLQQQLLSMSSLPEGAAMLWLNHPQVATYGQQLNNLEKISPLAGLKMADTSVATARRLWPTDPLQIAESQRWERLMQARNSNAIADSSYFRLQQQLEALAEKLIEQEQARGSLTISWLKTAVYQMQTGLNHEVPLEELLRQLSVATEQRQPASPLLIGQIDDRWNALLSRYHQLTRQDQTAR